MCSEGYLACNGLKAEQCPGNELDPIGDRRSLLQKPKGQVKGDHVMHWISKASLTDLTSSKPHVTHLASILWQVVERIKSVEVVDPEVCHGIWRSKADIDCHAPTPVFIGSHRPPGNHAGAAWAEVKL
jgi:hypothetical protein